MEKIRMDDFTRYHFLSGIKHAPDGAHACFVLHQADLDDNKYCSNLWVLDVKSERYYQLTAFDSEKSFLWLDNENIIFSDIRNSKDQEKKDAGEEFTQYYKINIYGGEATKLFRIPRDAASIKMIDNDTFMFISEYNLNQKELQALSEEEKTKELKARKEEKDYEVLEEVPFWANGEGWVSKKRNRLYVYHVKADTMEAVTDEDTSVESFHLNADKTKAAIIACRFKDVMPLTTDIIIYDLLSKATTTLTAKEKMNYSYADFLSRDTLIFTATDMKKYGVNENQKFYTMDLPSLATTCITPELDVALNNSVGSDCRYGSSEARQIEGAYLYFVTTEGNSSFLNRVNKDGKIEKITVAQGSVDGISIKNNHILFIGMRTNTLQEIFSVENNTEKQITKVNDWLKNDRKTSMPEKVSVETQPGVLIDGWVLKPVDFDETKKYPAILDIHGGPKTVYGTVFFHEMQYWASAGYVVFFCNPRGSDGKGNDFADIRGKYGTIDYEDIMTFTDAVLKKYPFIDGERIGVTGGSYGGYMTNWIIGHTNKFKAAASQRSISNWISKYCTTDIGYFFVEDQNCGTPWANQEKLWYHSPLKYADKVKTPTLFLHSEEDYRCWLAEGLQMFTALKLHGVESRLCLFRGENHELSRSGKPQHKLRRLREITEWFDRYVK